MLVSLLMKFTPQVNESIIIIIKTKINPPLLCFKKMCYI